MKSIAGPYKFGDVPPIHLMGWDEAAAIAQKEQVKLTLPPFVDTPLPQEETRTPIWEEVKRHRQGKHLPTMEQQVGDCVGTGLKQMGDYLTFAQLARQYREQFFRPWHASWLYGMSRVAYLLNAIAGDGSTGRAGALVVKNLGVYFEDWKSALPYSGQLSRQWGERPGPPRSIRDKAKPYTAIAVDELHTVGGIRNALLSDRLVTIASSRGFKMRPEEHLGYHIFQPSGSWMHQMCLLDWMDEPFPAAYRLNSWGADAHGTPLNGEPPGGAWNLEQHLVGELETRGVEVFAFSLFRAWPTEANHHLIYHPNHRSPPKPYDKKWPNKA